MSTRAAQALVPNLDASQAGVARGAQVQGKRSQHAEPGKIASAGFAQILGEQVAKSTPKAETSAKAGQGFVAPEAPMSPPKVPTQSLPQSPPRATTTPQALPYAEPATATVIPEESPFSNIGSLRVTTPAPRVRTEMAGQQAETGTNHRAPAQDTYPIKQPDSQSIAISNKPSASDPRPDSFATVPQPLKNEPAAIPAARIDQAVRKFMGRTEDPATPTVTPKLLSPPIHTGDQPVAADTAASAKSAETQGTARSPARHIEAPLPQPVPLAEVCEQLPTQLSPINGDVRVPIQPGNTARHLQPAATQPAATEALPRLTTNSNEATAPGARKPGQAAVHVPVSTGGTAPMVNSTASETTTRAPAPALPEASPASAPLHFAVPTSVGKSVEIPTQAFHTAHRPGSESIANISQQHTNVGTVDAASAPRHEAAIAQPLAARPSAHLPAAKPGESSEDTAQVVLATQAQEAQETQETQELSRPLPATAPRATATALPPKGPANLAPEAPAPDQPAPDQKESAPVQGHAPTGEPTVADASPAQERKPHKHPGTTQAPLAAQVPSPSVPPPVPTAVETENSAPAGSRNPEPVSPSETAPPMATVKSSPRAPVARPAPGHPGIGEEPNLTASTSEVKAPEPNATQAGPSNEHITRGTADRPATTSPEPAATLPAPVLAQLGNKGAIHAETLASKQRPSAEDEKKPDGNAPAQASAITANLLPSQASPGTAPEANAPKQEASQPTEYRATTPTTSQTSSHQSAAGQPPSAREDLQSPVLSTPERPTVFVPPTPLSSSTSDAGVREAPARSPVAVETAGLVDRAIQDPGLSVTVMPHSAHVSIAGDTGDLSLHVRVRDGSADVNVSGTMAPLFDSKAPEMRTALAGEGLQLGSFATDQRGGSQGHQGQPEDATRTNDPHPMPPQRQTNTSTPEVQITADRRIHVTA